MQLFSFLFLVFIIYSPQCNHFYFFMASHPTPAYLLRSQRSESPSISSSDFVATSVLLIRSTPFRIPSDQLSLPPSFASMPLRTSLIFPHTRPVGSQPSARRGRRFLLHLPVRPPHYVGFLPALCYLWRPLCLRCRLLRFLLSFLPSLFISPSSAFSSLSRLLFFWTSLLRTYNLSHLLLLRLLLVL